MGLELGMKVKFHKSLSKQSGYGVNMEHYTKDQNRQMDENSFINLERYKVRTHNEKSGFVCGKRDIVTSASLLEEQDDPYRDSFLYQTDEVWEDIYVVACDMRGLRRVRLEDLEVIKC